MKKTLMTGIGSMLLSQWWIPLLILVILFALYLFYQNRVDKKKYQLSNLDPEEKRVKIVTEGIILALGVGFSHPIYGENWSPTEDEEQVIKLLLDNEGIFTQISDKYHLLMSDSLTGGSDLITDLQKHLSNQEIKQIQHLWQ